MVLPKNGQYNPVLIKIGENGDGHWLQLMKVCNSLIFYKPQNFPIKRVYYSSLSHSANKIQLHRITILPTPMFLNGCWISVNYTIGRFLYIVRFILLAIGFGRISSPRTPRSTQGNPIMRKIFLRISKSIWSSTVTKRNRSDRCRACVCARDLTTRKKVR